MTRFGVLVSILCFALPAQSKIKVIASTADIKAIVAEVGGDAVDVESICKGNQDPHFIESKPSYILKVSKADLVIAVGLGLEKGWLPGIIRGARNAKVGPGTAGYLELGPQLNPIEVLGARKAQGHAHPEGNSHIFLDPIRVGHAAMLIAEKLSKLDESQSKVFLERAKKFQTLMTEQTKIWESKLSGVTVRKVVTYHTTLNYFLERFKLESVINLEPEPGTPPTASHIVKVLKAIKDQKVKLILVENYFDVKVAERIKDEAPGVEVVSVPVSVGGSVGVETSEKLFERLVELIVEKSKPTSL